VQLSGVVCRSAVNEMAFGVEDPMGAYFHEYLKRISSHLGTRSLPVFLDFNGERRRMDKGCIGHAVAAGMLKPAINGSDGITHVELAEGET
jgi:hypothetical protein